MRYFSDFQIFEVVEALKVSQSTQLMLKMISWLLISSNRPPRGNIIGRPLSQY